MTKIIDDIEVIKINTDNYHPEHKYMARLYLTQDKVVIGYGATELEAVKKVKRKIK